MSDCPHDFPKGLRRAVGLIGERWALLVLAALLSGPRRFSDLKQELPGISANVLTRRLQELQERGLVKRMVLPHPASVQVYSATKWGLKARPALEMLRKWASQRQPKP
jgi:DNA-binding HxlR family transcriptional regulator